LWQSKVFIHVESVWKHETVLEKSRWLPRKLKFTVLVHCIGEERPG
jgi:hypothetical protein